MRPLSDSEIALLELERRQWRLAGAKEAAIRAELGLTPTRYYQLLAAMIDRPEALQYDPVLVNRLRRRLDNRRRVRASRR